MVDNESKTAIIRHKTKKNISHMKKNQYNTRAMHKYNTVIFIRDIFSVYVIWEFFLLYITVIIIIKW